jgi:hypothetical protein
MLNIRCGLLAVPAAYAEVALKIHDEILSSCSAQSEFRTGVRRKGFQDSCPRRNKESAHPAVENPIQLSELSPLTARGFFLQCPHE